VAPSWTEHGGLGSGTRPTGTETQCKATTETQTEETNELKKRWPSQHQGAEHQRKKEKLSRDLEPQQRQEAETGGRATED
jgi:hypothetical protein